MGLKFFSLQNRILDIKQPSSDKPTITKTKSNRVTTRKPKINLTSKNKNILRQLGFKLKSNRNA